MKTEENGRIKLSWAQIAWGIGMMIMVGGAWADLRVQVARVATTVDLNSSRIVTLERRAESWRSVPEANASEGPQPRR